jgi:hypothetical protein
VITGLLKAIKVTGNGETATRQQNLPLTKPKNVKLKTLFSAGEGKD